MGSSRIFSLVVVAVISAWNLPADQIQYSELAITSGTLGSIHFDHAVMTLFAVSDTNAVTTSGPPLFISRNHSEVFFNIGGVGSGEFTDPSMGVQAQYGLGAFDYAGFVDFTVDSGLLLTYSAAFGGYELKTTIGPIVGPVYFDPSAIYGTTLGPLHITSIGDCVATPCTGIANSVFTATVIPEPSSLILLGTIGSILFYRLGRRPAASRSALRKG